MKMETRQALMAQEMKKAGRFERLFKLTSNSNKGRALLIAQGVAMGVAVTAISILLPPVGPITAAVGWGIAGTSFGLAGLSSLSIIAERVLKPKEHRENVEYLQKFGKIELDAIKEALEIINEHGYEHFRNMPRYGKDPIIADERSNRYLTNLGEKSLEQLIERKEELEIIQRRVDKLENDYMKKNLKANVHVRQSIGQSSSVLQALKRIRVVERVRNIPDTFPRRYNKLKGSKNNPAKFTSNGKYLR
jgi:hypothetical protein